MTTSGWLVVLFVECVSPDLEEGEDEREENGTGLSCAGSAEGVNSSGTVDSGSSSPIAKN